MKRLTAIDGGYVEPAKPVTPFTIIVTALALPHGGESVKCAWSDGGLLSYQVVYATDSVEAARAELDALTDAGLSGRDLAWAEEIKVASDSRRPVVAVSFDEQLHASNAPPDRVVSAGRTYWSAFLCGHGDLAAILLDYVDAPLSAGGILLVLRKSHDRWEVVETRGRWIASTVEPPRRVIARRLRSAAGVFGLR